LRFEESAECILDCRVPIVQFLVRVDSNVKFSRVIIIP
jgi:hypothetical protein